MKRKLLTLGIGLLLGTSFSYSQTLLDSIIVEKIHIATQADHDEDIANGIKSPIVIGATTYRIWVDMAPGASISSVYGDNNHALKIQTTTAFYNNDMGGSIASSIMQSDITGTNQYDSWVTLGGSSDASVAVYKQADIVTTPAEVTNLGLQLTPSFDKYPGVSLLSYSGTYTTINGEGSTGNAYTQGHGTNNTILIGQFTTDGTFSFELNLQLTDGGSLWENYASNSPNNGEFTNSTLIGSYAPNTPPTISLTASTTAFAGDAITINATASDDINVSKVEFFVDGTSISSSTTSPYTATWIATTGTHSITAVATDNDGASTTSTAVSVVVATPTLSVPTTASITKEGTAVTVNVTSNTAWTASTTDSWLTINPTTATSGDGSFTISAPANASAIRTATVTVSASGVTDQIITVTQDGTTAVADIKSDILIISPNPAKTFFSINSLGTANVLIYSLTGELVLNTTFSDDEKINIYSLSHGLYLVKIITNNSEQIHQLIIE